MRVTFPHLGNIWVPMKTLLTELRVDYVIPPPNSRRTLTIAVKYSPEGLCLPFKLTLGNFAEALEMGADTLLQAGGAGICRLGRYARTQEVILQDMGYQFEMLTAGVSEKKLQGIMQLFKRVSGGAPWGKIVSALRFALAKLNTLDEIEREVLRVRAREKQKGQATALFRQALAAVDGAGDFEALKTVKLDYLGKLRAVPMGEEEPLLVGLMGEFYVVLEPFANLDVEIELGKLGVEVRRSLFISEWTRFSLFLNPLGINEKKRLQIAARPYLKRDVGGDGWESVGEKVLHSHQYHGLVHLAPFTCMPEIIAQNIMPSVREEIPVLTVLCDEQMGKQGLITRLEAFVDLLKRRRTSQRQKAQVQKVGVH